MSSTYEEVCTLLSRGKFKQAESWLMHHPNKDDQWHFLYSKILMHKSWFDSAKSHLEKAIALNPTHKGYQKHLAQFMARPQYYSQDYYNGGHYRRRKGCCCCCCCDDLCHVSCLDLICLDTCCECMGGDLITCI